MAQSSRGARGSTLVALRTRVIVVIVALLGLLGALLLSLRTPAEWREGGGIVRPLAGAEAKATVAIALTLREGSDIQHESEHIFGALSALPGTARCRLIPSPPSIEVAYDPSVTSEKSIRDALAAAGYVGGGE